MRVLHTIWARCFVMWCYGGVRRTTSPVRGGPAQSGPCIAACIAACIYHSSDIGDRRYDNLHEYSYIPGMELQASSKGSEPPVQQGDGTACFVASVKPQQELKGPASIVKGARTMGRHEQQCVITGGRCKR